jgi:hypothetical protein
MRIVVLLGVVLGLGLPALAMVQGNAAATASPVVVFAEETFPAGDTPAPDVAQLKKLLPGARFATADQLPAALSEAETRLLVMPYGSAFPEAAWPGIFVFLEHGGNLLALGDKPFTRAAYRDSAGWHLRGYSVRFDLALMIDQWQETPGSAALQFENNPDVVLRPPRFSWQRAYSPIIRLGSVDIYQRGGSASYLDARLDALAWGVREGRRMAAPAIQIDHLRNRFTGGRWIFVNAELPGDFYGGAGKQLVPMLAAAALEGSQEFTVHPTLPLYLPGEPVQLEVAWQAATPAKTSLTLRITISPEEHPAAGVSRTEAFPLAQPLVLPAPSSKGLHIVEAEMLEGDTIRAVYRSGFWIRDENYLRSGPRLSVNQDYFERDGRPLAVLGTTYMSSDVQRLYFEHPNVYVWDRDLGQISAAGLNMIRTGWWTGWDKFCDENGRPYERTLRTLEAYLMTARRHGLPVQFNFFAFLPDALGGENAYLDPNAVRRQQTLVSSVAARFHDVPFLAWDLINEPSFSKHLWQMRPNGDAIELAKWNEWLYRRYPDRAALAAAWNLPLTEVQGTLPLPGDGEFQQRSMYDGPNSLKLYDYFLFAQESFAGWAQAMREAIRTTSSQQPITVGQDEGGYSDRLSPAFFGTAVDFTTNHSWWQNDSLLWDSLVAKQPGLPMLIQETGLQRELTLDQVSRRTPENEIEPLTFHSAEMQVAGQTVPLSFDLQKQSWLEVLRFSDGATLEQIAHGEGRIFWTAYPVELAEGPQAADVLYSYVLSQVGIQPPFELRQPAPGVLIYPTVLQDSVLYVLESESAEPTQIDLLDRVTGARLALTLPSQRAALALVRKANGAVAAKYGF